MDSSSGHHKLAKAKGRMVKPILKKRANSEKNSLDLDRPWEEQQVPGLGIGDYESTGLPRSARDVSFTFAESPALSGAKPRFQHTRSPSGASHTSVATAGSANGPRPGSFAHPYQQSPQALTPSLSYANSVASLDLSVPVFNNTTASSTRDYSPTITENEDDDDYPVGSLPTQRFHHSHTAPVTQANSRHGSLISQRTASFSDIPQLGTSRFVPNSRRVRRNSSLSSSMSHSDLHLHTSGASASASATFDSPTSPAPSVQAPAAPSATFAATSSPMISAGPRESAPGFGSSHTMVSPLRSSLEGVGLPRLRSRSEVDATARAEQIREARRKFEERERAKAEKHDREMQRKRERQAAQLRKNSGTGSDVVRPSLSRKSTHTFGSGNGSGSGSGSGSGNAGDHETGRDSSNSPSRQAPKAAEKTKPLAFKSSKYDSVAGGTTPSFGPGVDSVAFKNARRNNSTKHKTQGYWTGFVLWLRTRLFRMGRK